MISRIAESSTATQWDFQTQKKKFVLRQERLKSSPYCGLLCCDNMWTKDEIFIFSSSISENKTIHKYGNSALLAEFDKLTIFKFYIVF